MKVVQKVCSLQTIVTRHRTTTITRWHFAFSAMLS